MQLKVSWAALKDFAQDRGLSVQWVLVNNMYCLAAIDGAVELTAQIPMTNPPSADLTDFEDNFKDAGNQSPVSQVRTQFEQPAYLLQMSHGSALAVAPGAAATITIKIPGTFAGPNPPAPGRYIDEGLAWASPGADGDVITDVMVVDLDDVLGMGANTVIGTYFDSEVPAENQGWALHPVFPVEVDTIGWYGFIPAGLYLIITVQRASTASVAGNFYVNLKWGIKT